MLRQVVKGFFRLIWPKSVFFAVPKWPKTTHGRADRRQKQAKSYQRYTVQGGSN